MSIEELGCDEVWDVVLVRVMAGLQTADCRHPAQLQRRLGQW